MEKEFFGVMLDCSRNGVIRPSKVKEYADKIKRYGYNSLMLYTEDTFLIDGEEFFGYQRGAYSEEELKDIDKYCQRIGIELIPCIETLAHLNQIFRFRHYEKNHDIADILLLDDESTDELLEKMVSTCRKCFHSHTIHLGMDEAMWLGRGAHQDRFGPEERTSILLRHVKKMAELSKKYDFHALMWGDMFYKLANNGEYFGKNIKIDELVKKSLPKNISLVYWDYYHVDEETYSYMMKAGKELDPSLYFAGGNWTWTGFAPNMRFSLATMKSAMLQAKANGIKNVFITMWGDNGKECSYASVLPLLYAFRQFYLGETSLGKIAKKYKEEFGEDLKDYLLLDEVNLSHIFKDPRPSNLSKWSFYNDPLLGSYDPYVFPTYQSEFPKVMKRLKKASKRVELSEQFEMEAHLASFLEVKYALGVKTRDAYHKGREELSKIIPLYAKARKRLRRFYDSFRRCWMEECKPFGFEIQDARIGGLLLRLESVEKTLKDYLDRKIASIPELEAPLIDAYPEQDTSKGELTETLWSRIISGSCV